jgi:hypothetical protein
MKRLAGKSKRSGGTVRKGVKIGSDNSATKEASVHGRDGSSLLLSGKNAFKAIMAKLSMCTELEESAITNCMDAHLVEKAAARRKRFLEQIFLDLTKVFEWFEYVALDENKAKEGQVLFGYELQQANRAKKQERVRKIPPPQTRNLSMEQVLVLWKDYQEHCKIVLEGKYV